MKFRSLGVLMILLTSACLMEQKQKQGQDQDGITGPGGGGGGTFTVTPSSINDYFGSCAPNTFKLKASKQVIWRTANRGVVSAGGTSDSVVVTKNKVGQDTVIAIDPSNQSNQVRTSVNLSTCPTTANPSGILTPLGPQTIVHNQSEIYFFHIEPMTFDQRFELRQSGSCVSSQILGPAAGTGYTQIKFTGTTVGKCTVTAVSVANPAIVSNPIEFTVISSTGTVGNAYITIDEVTSWTTTVGSTKQFKATCHNFPSNVECKPYWYSIGASIIQVNGETKTLTNDPYFGTGTILAGTVKATGKGSTQLYVQANKFYNAIYNFIPVTVN